MRASAGVKNAYMRRELRRITPDVKVEIDDVRTSVMQDVLKREVIEGEQADHARKRVQRAGNRMLRSRKESEDPELEAALSPPAASPVEAPPYGRLDRRARNPSYFNS